MAMISMAVYDTVENKRTEFTRKTLESLAETVDFSKHHLYIIDNNSCQETKTLLNSYCFGLKFKLITNEKNIGTAEALNLAWKNRGPGVHCIKIDNDIVIHSKGWADEMEEAVRRDPLIGQVGLKRKDLIESPFRTDWFQSELEMLPHQPGERWMIVERCHHIMGTCVMHSSALLDKVGYLKQPGIYGFDDSLMSMRSRLSGFKNIFLSYINIDHIDPGGTDYTTWKQDYAGKTFRMFEDLKDQYNAGDLSLYYNPFV